MNTKQCVYALIFSLCAQTGVHACVLTVTNDTSDVVFLESRNEGAHKLYLHPGMTRQFGAPEGEKAHFDMTYPRNKKMGKYSVDQFACSVRFATFWNVSDIRDLNLDANKLSAKCKQNPHLFTVEKKVAGCSACQGKNKI